MIRYYFGRRYCHSAGYGKAENDYWSFGVLLYEMLANHSPFVDCDTGKLFSNIVNREYSCPLGFSGDSLKDTPDISQSKHSYSTIIHQIYFCMFNFSGETNTVFFYLLHAIFVPTFKKVTRDHNGKINQVKHSIKDHKIPSWFLIIRFVKLRNTSLYGPMKKNPI